MDVTQIARTCHEANRAYCASLGDDSQPSWEDAPSWQQNSAINGVTFHLDELKAGRTPRPQASHENWLAEKLADGWVYGEKKDPDSKIHPCCVPYDKLPEEQKQKDYIFISIVMAFWEGTLSDNSVFAKVAREATEELQRACQLHRPMNNAHEGIAVIEEEYLELREQVYTKQQNRDVVEMRKEAVQIAAMAMRFVIDVVDSNRAKY